MRCLRYLRLDGACVLYMEGLDGSVVRLGRWGLGVENDAQMTIATTTHHCHYHCLPPPTLEPIHHLFTHR